MRQVILSEKELHEICVRIGGELNTRLKKEGSLPVFVGVMKGGLNFMMDLIKQIDLPILTDYIQISSYSGTASTGIINLKKDLTLDVKDKTVVIVEDVIDTGYSMHYLKNYIVSKYHPKEVIIVALIDKTFLRKVEVKTDYCGTVMNENKFLMGYGLDYNELYRNVPYVYVPDKEEIAEYDHLLGK
ncbi:MAG: hypoxanthine phosphoribosyltransferase [Bacilli bacterium]|jgi:hypoxanthine phosphoribosyltransferase|nr:hypoxanthine phosphoribosyltransferase [Bacilli bacterium]